MILHFISVVHEIHPSHAFLLIPEPPLRIRSEPEQDPFADLLPEESLGEQCMHHICLMLFMVRSQIKLQH